jgi:copper chaperone CopZ
MHQTDTTRTYSVYGMTCSHCVLSVREEVSELAGVQAVEIDLASGRMTVVGEASDEQVKAAVAEAGYEVV